MDRTPTSSQAWGLGALRVVVGIVFVMHGYQKLAAFGIGGVAGLFGQLGIPLPLASAVVVTAVEAIGGLALVLGIFTRPFAALLAVTMLVAAVTAHLPNGFFLPNGVEYVLTLFAATLALTLAGPGSFSLAGRLSRRQAAA